MTSCPCGSPATVMDDRWQLLCPPCFRRGRAALLAFPVTDVGGRAVARGPKVRVYPRQVTPWRPRAAVCAMCGVAFEAKGAGVLPRGCPSCSLLVERRRKAGVARRARERRRLERLMV